LSDDTLDIDELDDIEADPEPEEDAPKSDEERGPGLLSKVGSKVAAPFAQISWGNLISIKTGIIALIGFLLVWLLLVNLAPVRLVLWFWAVDVPKAAAFIVDVALGALLMWLWLRPRVKGDGGKEEGK